MGLFSRSEDEQIPETPAVEADAQAPAEPEADTQASEEPAAPVEEAPVAPGLVNVRFLGFAIVYLNGSDETSRVVEGDEGAVTSDVAEKFVDAGLAEYL